MSVFLSLGSNQGSREEKLTQAVDLLQEIPEVTVLQVSDFYETEPWGGVEQGLFLNIVLKMETTLTPLELLIRCQKIENQLGRVRDIHWGQRVIDIDILSFDNLVINTEELTLPHQYMEQREFVLAPLREIEPDFLLASGKLVKDARGEGEVIKILKKTFPEKK